MAAYSDFNEMVECQQTVIFIAINMKSMFIGKQGDFYTSVNY